MVVLPMTVKRFKLFIGNNYGVQTMDGEVIFDSIRSIADADVLVDLLNDLSEENEQLKTDIQLHIDDSEKYRKLSLQFDNRNKELISENALLEKENEQLKAEVTHWQILLNNYKEMMAKTLREQYEWLKNEDKILNHDKTVALLEIESIATYLGVDLE